MFEIIENVIKEGRYNLTELLAKIDTIWVQGGLTDEEKTTLVQEAQANAELAGSVDILEKIEELDARVRALEGAGGDIAEYTPGTWYYSGDKVSFGDKNYVCIAPGGQVCTWSPAEYPAYWQEIETGYTESAPDSGAEETQDSGETEETTA